MTYRKDIDGLRALAVIPVVLFHLDWGVSGGYVGVDVFFVISGFLIGSIVIREIEEGRFSLLRFWERRVRRILPALSVVVLATAIAGLFWMIPRHLEELGKSILAQPFLAANFYFWRESGYFETAAEYQPLLQTWSLAVEEQFYLFFPLVMLLLFRLGHKIAVVGILAFIGVSLGWSVFSTNSYPSLSFYLLPSRIWELDLGVLLALLRVKEDRPRWVNECLSWKGIILILISVFTFDLNTPFPGTAAILPCLGAALVIFGNSQRPTSSSAVLGWGPIRFIGLISYSLYLWHWPLIVFTRYLNPGELSEPTKVALLILAFVLATLSWRFVERPFRRSKQGSGKSTRTVLAIGAAVSLGTVAIGLTLSKSDGFPGRFSPETLALGEVDSPYKDLRARDQLAEEGSLPIIGTEVAKASAAPVLVWGDSHAMSLLTAFDELGKSHGATVYVAAHPSTPPLIQTWTPRIGHDAIHWGEEVIAQIEALEIKTVFMTGRWQLFLEPTADGDRRNLIADESGSDRPAEVFTNAFERTLDRLSQMDVEVWVMDDVPLQDHSVPETLMLASIREKDLNVMAKSMKSWWAETHFTRQILKRAINPTFARRLDPVPLLVDQAGSLPMAKDGNALYSDEHHLSPFGASQLIPLLEPIFTARDP